MNDSCWYTYLLDLSLGHMRVNEGVVIALHRADDTTELEFRTRERTSISHRLHPFSARCTHSNGLRTGAGEQPKPGYILFLKLPALPDMLLAPRLPDVEPSEPAETKRGPGWMDQDVLLSALRGEVPAYRGFAKWCGG